MLFYIFPAVALSAIAAWTIQHLLLSSLRRWLLDQPNARSSHSQPTPRGGGVVFVIVAALTSSISCLGAVFGQSVLPVSQLFIVALPLLALPVAVVGFFDDRHNLPAILRYWIQLATSLLMLLVSPLSLPFWSLPLLLIALTAVINFTNFMDGLDGLVTGCMAVAIASVGFALAAPWPLWALVGSLLGFLPWNWSPAKVFMGDVGSTFLGAVFAGLVLQASSWQRAFGYLLVASPLLADACLCVIRRLLDGQRVFQAHRLHLFQRLHQAGWPHARVSFTYIVATAFLAVAMLAGGWPWVFSVAVTELFIGVWLDQRFAVPFTVASDI